MKRKIKKTLHYILQYSLVALLVTYFALAFYFIVTAVTDVINAIGKLI